MCMGLWHEHFWSWGLEKNQHKCYIPPLGWTGKKKLFCNQDLKLNRVSLLAKRMCRYVFRLFLNCLFFDAELEIRPELVAARYITPWPNSIPRSCSSNWSILAHVGAWISREHNLCWCWKCWCHSFQWQSKALARHCLSRTPAVVVKIHQFLW